MFFLSISYAINKGQTKTFLLIFDKEIYQAVIKKNRRNSSQKKHPNSGILKCHEPDALSGRFAVAPTGLVDSTLNAAHRAAASVDA